jgi:hypothetical protein
MGLVLTVSGNPSSEGRFVLELLLEKWWGLDVRYGAGGDGRGIEIRVSPSESVVRLPDVASITYRDGAGTAWLAWLPRVPPPSAGIYRECAAAIPHVINGNVCELKSDILSVIFAILAGVDEALLATRDQHDRVPGSASLLGREGVLRRPVVDELAEILWCLMRAQWPTLERRQMRFATTPTHDLDAPYLHIFRGFVRGLKVATVDAFLEGGVKGIGDALRRRERVRKGDDAADPFFSRIDWLMDENERAGLRGTFYVLCGRSAGGIDGGYDIRHPRIRRLLRRIHARGHEIGLHPSYRCYKDKSLLACELKNLQAVCGQEGIDQSTWKCRMHYLRWDPVKTPECLEAAGIDGDSTLAFADRVGFRRGTARQFPLWNLTARRPTRVLEQPLIAMEGTLLERKYEGLAHQQVLGTLLSLKEACQRLPGNFTFLWHNSNLRTPELQEIYRTLVRA